jgi:hypothetical protein
MLDTGMEYLSRSTRISRMDRIRNETIRTEMGMKKDMLQETEQQVRWRGYVMQMKGCRIARRVAEWNPQGNGRRDRPVSTWKDEIRDRIQRRNLNDEECFDPVLSREKNHVFGLRKTVFPEKFIHTACPRRKGQYSGRSFGHSTQKSVYVSYSERFPRQSYFTQYFQRMF